MKKVLVTGANGHLGYNVTRLLLEHGYAVRASVRNSRDAARTGHLAPLGVEIVEADVLLPNTLVSAMDGVDGVFHVAAVYDITARNPEKNVREPNVTGTLNVLRAAKSAGVRRLVLTSSTTAVGNDARDGEALTEEQWNESAVEPYARSKVEAERLAWQFSRDNGIDIVTILPAAMLGPGFFRHTPTTQSFEQLLLGKIPFVLPLSFSFVDVRDVARAHIAAYENEAVSGRYIVSDRFCSLKELFETVHRLYPRVKLPSKEFPAAMLRVVPFLDWMSNVIAKTPRFATAEFVKEYACHRPVFSSARTRKELGWRPQVSFEQSVRDTVEWINRTFLANAA